MGEQEGSRGDLVQAMVCVLDGLDEITFRLFGTGPF